MMMKNPHHQQGVALVIVLLIVAIVVILASEMTGRLQLNVQRAQNIKDNNQAQWYALSAEEFARKSIQTLMETESDKIHLNQPWSEEFMFPMDGGGIQANLVDMQSCFNLNALSNFTADEQNNQSVTPIMEAFQRMLLNLEEPLDSYTADTIRDSLADWMDSDERTRDFGAEDSEYSSKAYSYLAANRQMASQSEFRVIHGVSAEWINRLWPLICVIPNNPKMSININTLDETKAPILAGILGVTLNDAQDIIGSRPSDGWDSVEDFMTESRVETANITQQQQEWLAVTTEYFLLHTKTRYNKASFSLSSLFHVSKSTPAKVIRREIGGLE